MRRNSVFYPLCRTVRVMYMSYVFILGDHRTRNFPGIVKGGEEFSANFEGLSFVRQGRCGVARIGIAYFGCSRGLRSGNEFSIRECIKAYRCFASWSFRYVKLCVWFSAFGRAVWAISFRGTLGGEFAV